MASKKRVHTTTMEDYVRVASSSSLNTSPRELQHQLQAQPQSQPQSQPQPSVQPRPHPPNSQPHAQQFSELQSLPQPQEQEQQESFGACTNSTVSNASKKKGRGPSKGFKGWGNGEILHLDFNEKMQPIGENSTTFATQLGILAKCGARLPLNLISWSKMPKSNRDRLWQEIQV